MKGGVKTLNRVLNLVSVVLFLRQSHDTVQTSLKFTILLPQPLEGWENLVYCHALLALSLLMIATLTVVLQTEETVGLSGQEMTQPEQLPS